MILLNNQKIEKMENSHMEKSYEWIVSAIQSSNNPFHVECCRKLIELFTAKFNDSIKEGELSLMLHDKSNNINYI
jgi:hypothetical protein